MDNIYEQNLALVPQLTKISKKIENKCGEIFKKLGFKYFIYNRFYEGDKYVLVMTGIKEEQLARFLKEPLDRDILSPHYDHQSTHRQYLGWSFFPEDPMLLYLKSQNIWNGLSIYQNRGEYIEAMHFASAEKDKEIQNLYVNNQKLIDQLIVLIKETLKEIEKKGNNLPKLKYKEGFHLIFPKTDRSISRQSHPEKYLDSMGLSKYTLEFNGIEESLTRIQLNVLNMIIRGMTDKEIARYLEISPRTVESYANVIKKKFKLDTRRELLNLWDANPLIKSLF